MSRGVVIAVVCGLAGCYRSGANGLAPCTVSCEPGDSCPGDLTCIAGLCRNSDGTCEPTTGNSDAPPGSGDGSDACTPRTIGRTPGFIKLDDTCAALPPVTLDTAFNTNPGGALCDPGMTSVCLVQGSTITLTNAVRVVGSRPLVLFATDSILVTGTLDAASKSPGLRGPGGDGPGCNVRNGTNGDGSHPGSGGPGGSFQGLGGTGGGAGGNADAGAGTELSASLRGGCPGGLGGTNNGGQPGGSGGSGGGAVYMLAANKIAVEVGAKILVGGSGGLAPAGVFSAGGGGGGSGGLIAFDATEVVIDSTAILLASGGGGAEGTGNAGISFNGADADEPTLTTGATGGASNSPGGDGGLGSTRSVRAGGNGGTVTTSTDGGGGGGGAAGFIIAFCANLPGDAHVSPDITVNGSP